MNKTKCGNTIDQMKRMELLFDIMGHLCEACKHACEVTEQWMKAVKDGLDGTDGQDVVDDGVG